jgi:hypothetical protein
MPYSGGGVAVSVSKSKEVYNNHLGATDNFTETITAGNGAATTDATNHKKDLSTGITIPGHGVFQTKKTWSLSANELICNILVQGLQMNVDGSSYTYLGLKADFTAQTAANSAAFYQTIGGSWFTVSNDGISSESNAITAPVNGDLLTVIATSSEIQFYKNGTLLHTHASKIPSVAVHAGSMVKAAVAASTARLISVDYIGTELQM